MSFLSKLINEQEAGIQPKEAKPVSPKPKAPSKPNPPPATKPTPVVKERVLPEPTTPITLQLSVDVWQAIDRVTIFAPVPGATMDTINISIEGDSDIVIIEGKMENPQSGANFKRGVGQPSAIECVWGDFYRQIVLPDSIDVENADASLNNGVLVLELPFLNSQA